MSSLTRSLATLGRRVLCQQHKPCTQSLRRMGGGGTWHYRDEMSSVPDWHFGYAFLIGFTMICWSGYMSYNHFGHIVGDFPIIEPSKWTDEELGIPPDDEDVYPEGYIPLNQRNQ